MIRTLFLILFLIHSWAFAQQPSTLKSKSQTIPKALIAQGIEKMGDLDLRELVHDQDTVTWERNNSSFTLAGSGKPRTGAIYLVEQRKVIVNAALPINPNILPVLTLHESKGALGFMDENGEMSLSLAAELYRREKYGDSAVPIPSLQKPFEGIQKRTKNTVYGESGGVTSVGGGGDAGCLEVKLVTILYLTDRLQEMNPGKKDFKKIDGVLARVIDAEFENDTAVMSYDVSFKKNKGRDLVLVPYSEWLFTTLSPNSPFAAEKRNRILSGILEYFLADLQ